jgi:hypothetical protein
MKGEFLQVIPQRRFAAAEGDLEDPIANQIV